MSEPKPELRDLKLHKEFDDQGLPDGPPPAPAVYVEGRCTVCWGQAAGRVEHEGRWTRLECRACGAATTGRGAQSEMQQMLDEANANLSKARLGRPSRYRSDAQFVLKIFPDMVRDVAKIDSEIAAQLKDVRTLENARKERKFTRREFGEGGAGNFYLQACALMAAIDYLPDDFGLIPPLQTVLEKFEASEVTEDRAAGRKRLRFRGVLEAEKPDLIKKVGANLLASLTAAFACELALKAILMTRDHIFKMTHDLKELHDALPPDCRERLKADFPQIVAVLSARRGTFDKLRYFNPTENPKSIDNLIDSDGAHDLVTAARVLIDEGFIVGLGYSVEVGAEIRYEVDKEGTEQGFGQVQFTASECAINWDDLVR